MSRAAASTLAEVHTVRGDIDSESLELEKLLALIFYVYYLCFFESFNESLDGGQPTVGWGAGRGWEILPLSPSPLGVGPGPGPWGPGPLGPWAHAPCPLGPWALAHWSPLPKKQKETVVLVSTISILKKVWEWVCLVCKMLGHLMGVFGAI